MKISALVWPLAGIGVVALVVVDRLHNDAALAQLRKQVANMPRAATDDGSRERETRFVLFPGSAEGTASPTPAGVRLAASASTPQPSSDDAGRPTTVQEDRSAYEAAFVDDHGDPDWTAKALRDATGKLNAALPPGSVLRSFECRATMCRIETSHANKAQYLKFARAAFRDGPTRLWNGGVFSTTLSDDVNAEPLVTVAFVSREGHPLPTVE